MDTEDGRLFIKHLAYYIRTHEKALANSLLSRPLHRRHSTSNATVSSDTSSWKAASRAPSGDARPSTSGGLLSSFPVGRTNKGAKPPRLFLTPNQLYYLLIRFEELGVNAGPLNVRVENLHADTPSSNYMSFLAHTPSSNVRDTDADSIHSVVSVRSTMSSMSSLWSHFNFSGSAASRAEKQDAAARDDVRYLYSAFTKIPCVKLSVDARFRPITGFEEFPFDTAIPIHAFKNLTEFEVSDIDFRSVYGWDRLADQLRVLVVRRASLDDVSDLLTKVVLDDMDQRRRKSSKTPSTPISAHPSHNPFRRSGDWTQSLGPSDPPLPDRRPGSSGASRSPNMLARDARKGTPRPRLRSISPQQLGETQQSPVTAGSRPIANYRRSSNSSTSSPVAATPRQSSSNLSLMGQLPAFKWRFLRHLSVADNGLTSITAEALSPLANTLQSLDVSSNLFTEIPDCLSSLVALRALNVSNCMIDSVRSLTAHPLPAITVLNLRANRISSLIGVEKLKSLQRLDVRENRITDPVEISRLTEMPDFYDVYVKGNPFTTTHHSHRITIFNLFRAVPGSKDDVTIDATGPSYGERRHLADHAIESPAVPVVRQPYEEDERLPSLSRDIEDPSTGMTPPEGLVEQRSDDIETAAIKSVKKKGQKRRVADLPQSQSLMAPRPLKAPVAAESSLESTGHPVTSAKQIASNPVEGKAAVGSPVRRSSSTASAPIEMSADPEIEMNGKTETSGKLADSLSQSSEVYKKRIEALKNDRGSAWLTAIENIKDPPQEPLTGQTTVVHSFKQPHPQIISAGPEV